MQTSVGVFSTRADAENAVRELLNVNIPADSITFMTPEIGADDSAGFAKGMGAYVGGAVGGGAGLSIGVAAASLAIPGIGPILAIGIGAAALLGLGGAAVGGKAGSAIDSALEEEAQQQNPEATFFRKVLKEKHSVIVVRTEDADVYQKACMVLDRLGIRMAGEQESIKSCQISTRDISSITVVSLAGRVALGQGSGDVRELIHKLVGQGRNQILLDLEHVTYVDSSGIGELVGAMTTVRNAKGALRLTKVPGRVRDLLQVTHLDKVFEIKNDEAEAISSFVVQERRAAGGTS